MKTIKNDMDRALVYVYGDVNDRDNWNYVGLKWPT